MERTRLPILLTLALFGDQGAGPSRQDTTDIEVRTLQVADVARLCAGRGNAVRVELVVHGRVPDVPVPLQLVLRVPGGDPLGVVLGDAGVRFAPGATRATFTFVNIELPLRLRGRGGMLEARANLRQRVAEGERANNSRTLALDMVTDWNCAR